MTDPDANLSDLAVVAVTDQGPTYYTLCNRCQHNTVVVMIGTEPKTHLCERCKDEINDERPSA